MNRPRMGSMRTRAGVIAAAIALCAGVASGAPVPTDGVSTGGGPEDGDLHVPSPDWRDQVIYFVMIDRFADGDAGNNDQGAGEYAPADPARYSGGDLAGLTRRLDYIAGLGASAVWVTPPVAHQWWNQATRYGGYHGYWAQDFARIDPHFGTLADYRQLSRALHGRGMYLIQDVVVNHVANYTGYAGGWNAQDPSTHFVVHPAGGGPQAPTRMPFALNDARNPAHRAAAIYHWTPDIADFSDRRQELEWQLAGLDDLNTENPRVREALRRDYGHWIREAGVDAFRVDTAFHVPPEFFADFMDAGDATHPGMREVAAATGRQGFHAFGEGFGVDKPFDDSNARKLESYVRDPQGRALLPAMINFPLYGTLGDVFARGRPTAQLAHRIGSVMRVHAAPHLMPTFVDNHDVDRFLAGGSEAGLKQALLAIMTLPGIPTLYYGTEQGFTAQRAAMFAGGVDSGGRDRFDPQAPLYRYVQRAVALRRGDRLFSRGVPSVLADNAAAPGAIAWRVDHEGRSAIVAFNSADTPTLLDNLATGLPAGTRLQGAFAIDGEAPVLTVDGAGRTSLVLAPRAGYVWRPDARTVEVGAASSLHLDPGPARVAEDFALQGRAAPGMAPRLVVDGDLARAQPIVVAADGTFSARVDTRDMLDPSVRHCAVAWDEASGATSARHCFEVARTWDEVVDRGDPAGDDHGPQERYRYPLDAGWSVQRPADIHGVRVWTSGGALKLELRMASVSRVWNPANGFDHVAFTVFLELPGREGGATVMPFQNATLPDAMRWHYRLRAHGWSNVLHAAAEASATSEGTPVSPAARIDTDTAADTVTFTLSGAALGYPPSLAGARLYVSTWDFDAGARALTAQAQAHSFGGGDGARDPLIMDDTGVIVLP